MNVSSATTLKPLPMLAVYTATKAALEAFTASLALELQPFDVRVRLVIPGQAPETTFGGARRGGGDLARGGGSVFPDPPACRRGRGRAGPIAVRSGGAC